MSIKSSAKGVMLEFKKFAMRGSVMDMAVGIIIGGAFGKIVDSLVKDVIMPPIGLLLGRVDFSNLYILLKDGANVHHPYDSLSAAQAAGAVTINIGAFINNIISFLVVAIAVFMLVKFLNKLQHQPEPGPATTKKCTYCYTDIPIQAVKCPNCTADLK